jgi:hypothetical protein
MHVIGPLTWDVGVESKNITWFPAQIFGLLGSPTYNIALWAEWPERLLSLVKGACSVHHHAFTNNITIHHVQHVNTPCPSDACSSLVLKVVRVWSLYIRRKNLVLSMKYPGIILFPTKKFCFFFFFFAPKIWEKT